ncbi:MAG TPA: acyl-CoA dehydrogenase family protein [Puia sp.]|jgi:alkylation response protein AidB-like acyl-CoA dehydrogenase|nr:acyl-CoA dehydrogenase family protein [Puia sp.]
MNSTSLQLPNLTDAKADPDILQKARELSAIFRKTASENEAKGEFPVRNFELLKQENFLALVIPKKMGGLGADYSTYTKVLTILATGDLGTALCYNMHHTALGPIAEANPTRAQGRVGEHIERFRRRIFDEVIGHRKVFASASSEPGVGSNFSKYKATYERCENGFVLNGTKSFVSMSTYTDYFVFPAKPKGKESTNLLSFFIVPRDTPGIRILNNWNPIALRPTVSNTVIFEDCVVDKDSMFMGVEGLAFYSLLKDPHWVIGGFAPAYLGLCQSTFDLLLEYVREKKHYQVGASDLLESRVGELAADLEVATHIVGAAASMVDMQADDSKMEYYLFLAKHLVNLLVTKMTREAIQICGGGGLSRSFDLERYYREAICCAVMPATRDQCVFYFGRQALGADVRGEKHHVWQ